MCVHMFVGLYEHFVDIYKHVCVCLWGCRYVGWGGEMEGRVGQMREGAREKERERERADISKYALLRVSKLWKDLSV